MGKQRKLRSSIKALHDALTSFRPAVGAPLCMQPAKTHSFRDIFASFDSVDYVLPVAAASPASYLGPCSRHGLLLLGHPQEAPPSAENGLACKVEEGREDERSISLSAATTATSSSTSCSSCLSSSSSSSLAAAVPDNADAKEDHPFPSGIACSERFFFSPCSSKSIAAAESSPEMGPKKASPLRFVTGGSEGDYRDEEDVFDVLLERETGDTLIDWAAATGVSALCRESVPVAFSSRDLYGDFRSSMEEMVAAHGLRDWPDLQELLHCYLRLNDKETHKVIALAFVDLLVHLSSQGKLHSSTVHGAAASTPMFFPSPPPLPPASGLHPSPSPC